MYGNQIPRLWWNETTWIQKRDQWLLQPIMKANEETEIRRKKKKKLL